MTTKIKMEIKLFFNNGPEIRVERPKKIARKEGIKTIEKGTKNLKLSSKVKELEIQYVPDKKNPIPNR